MRRRWIHFCLLSLLASAGQRAMAQTSVAFEGFAGYYRPLGHFDPAPIYTTDLPQTPSQLAGLLSGGSAQFVFANRFGIEATASTAASTLPSCACPGGSVLPPTPARVSIASLVGQYDFSHRPARYHLWVSAGPALIHHGGTAFGRYGSPTSWGATAGLELGVPVARHVDVLGAASGTGYSFNLASFPERGRQLDALVSVGLRWHSGS